MSLTTRTFAPPTALAAALAALAIGVPAAQADTATSSVGHMTAGQSKPTSKPRARTAGAGCPGTDARPGSVSVGSFRASTLCLLNRERRARGMRKLRTNKRLGRAARGHASDMAQRDYFAHDSLSGQSFTDRIRHTGYLSHARSWTVGENLAWGTGHKGSPREIVVAWMNSPEHRANILQRRFREIGIGVVGGAPQGNAQGGATYATDFGARR
jgi:uncharacterized protein YkwD